MAIFQTIGLFGENNSLLYQTNDLFFYFIFYYFKGNVLKFPSAECLHTSHSAKNVKRNRRFESRGAPTAAHKAGWSLHVRVPWWVRAGSGPFGFWASGRSVKKKSYNLKNETIKWAPNRNAPVSVFWHQQRSAHPNKWRSKGDRLSPQWRQNHTFYETINNLSQRSRHVQKKK